VNRKIFSRVLVVLWMGLIFYMSHTPATESNGMSMGITEGIVDVVEKVVPGVDIELGEFNHFVRKSAHFFSYLVLGVLVTNGLKRSEIKGYFGLAVVICVLYAVIDEIHQIYVPGRSGQITDVVLDSAGALVGIGLRSVSKFLD